MFCYVVPSSPRKSQLKRIVRPTTLSTLPLLRRRSSPPPLPLSKQSLTQHPASLILPRSEAARSFNEIGPHLGSLPSLDQLLPLPSSTSLVGQPPPNRFPSSSFSTTPPHLLGQLPSFRPSNLTLQQLPLPLLLRRSSSNDLNPLLVGRSTPTLPRLRPLLRS